MVDILLVASVNFLYGIGFVWGCGYLSADAIANYFWYCNLLLLIASIFGTIVCVSENGASFLRKILYVIICVILFMFYSLITYNGEMFSNIDNALAPFFCVWCWVGMLINMIVGFHSGHKAR